MTVFLLAAEQSGEAASGIGALGVSASAFIIQFVTFLLVFLLLKRFAFKPIVKLLAERRKVIDDGVRLGREMEKEKAKLDEEVAKVMSKARHEGDQIIASAHKESRQIVHEAEKAAQHKADLILADTEERIKEEAETARRHLEKELVGLVSEATEAIVGLKVNSKRDAELVKKALKGSSK